MMMNRHHRLSPPSLLLSWLFFFSTLSTTTTASLAPWQQSIRPSAKDEDIYGDKPLIVFWPGGRLHSVERAVAAASSKEDPSSNLVVAISCREGIVIVTTLPTSPHLDTETTTTMENDKNVTISLLMTNTNYRAPLSRLAETTWMVTGGNAVDSNILQSQIRRLSESLLQANDGGQSLSTSTLSCAILARKTSDHLQTVTQTMGNAGRILASFALIAGRNDKNSYSLWRIDPSGQFWKCSASCIGRGAAAAEEHLLKVISSKNDSVDLSTFFRKLSIQEAISMACECIDTVLPKENKLYWQALILRPPLSENGDQASTSQVLNGDEIVALLKSISKQ